MEKEEEDSFDSFECSYLSLVELLRDGFKSDFQVYLLVFPPLLKNPAR